MLYHFLRILQLVFFLVCVFVSTTASALSLSFAWDENMDYVEGYRLFYRMQGESYDFSEPAWEGTETTCTLYDLDDDNVYYFVVKAYNAYGLSRSSNEVRWPQESSGGCLINASRW